MKLSKYEVLSTLYEEHSKKEICRWKPKDNNPEIYESIVYSTLFFPKELFETYSKTIYELRKDNEYNIPVISFDTNENIALVKATVTAEEYKKYIKPICEIFEDERKIFINKYSSSISLCNIIIRECSGNNLSNNKLTKREFLKILLESHNSPKITREFKQLILNASAIANEIFKSRIYSSEMELVLDVANICQDELRSLYPKSINILKRVAQCGEKIDTRNIHHSA